MSSTPYSLYIEFPRLSAHWDQPGWPFGVVVAAGFQAAELCLRLVEEALADARPEAFAERRLRRYVALLADGLALERELIAAEPADPPEPFLDRSAGPAEAGAGLPTGFAALDRLDPAALERVARAFGTPAHYRIGVEEHLAAACGRHGVAGPVIDASRPRLRYRSVVRPDVVRAPRAVPPSGPEDHLFRIAHQITECWLRVARHYHDDAARLAGEGRWEPAAARAESAARAIDLASAAGQLLELMNLADYHPLSVRLRDASGAQSPAAQRLALLSRDLIRPLVAALARQGRSPADLLDRPGTALAEFRYLHAVQAVAKSCQAFFFMHYLLVTNVHGAHGAGTLGYAIRGIGERAIRPPMPDLDLERHQLSMIMHLRHAAEEGVDILRAETGDGPAADPDPDAVPCPPETIRAAVEAYFASVSDADAEAWAGLFAADGQFRLLPATRPYRGRGHLTTGFRSFAALFPKIRASYSELSIDGAGAAVRWEFDAVSFLGSPVRFGGTERFRFGPDGLIASATAEWDARAVADQVWADRKRP
ncbi:nuclear transport factor 2 family protein [Dactylosporangium sp. CA-092794]|uniref:nuclear transport factor 2 family protein n=1 Tax=Dactylosporangium sp. CA-092794 TaxID=3239929 RepID=UPI003D914858